MVDDKKPPRSAHISYNKLVLKHPALSGYSPIARMSIVSALWRTLDESVKADLKEKFAAGDFPDEIEVTEEHLARAEESRQEYAADPERKAAREAAKEKRAAKRAAERKLRKETRTYKHFVSEHSSSDSLTQAVARAGVKMTDNQRLTAARFLWSNVVNKKAWSRGMGARVGEDLDALRELTDADWDSAVAHIEEKRNVAAAKRRAKKDSGKNSPEPAEEQMEEPEPAEEPVEEPEAPPAKKPEPEAPPAKAKKTRKPRAPKAVQAAA